MTLGRGATIVPAPDDRLLDRSCRRRHCHLTKSRHLPTGRQPGRKFNSVNTPRASPVGSSPRRDCGIGPELDGHLTRVADDSVDAPHAARPEGFRDEVGNVLTVVVLYCVAPSADVWRVKIHDTRRKEAAGSLVAMTAGMNPATSCDSIADDYDRPIELLPEIMLPVQFAELRRSGFVTLRRLRVRRESDPTTSGPMPRLRHVSGARHRVAMRGRGHEPRADSGGRWQ